MLINKGLWALLFILPLALLPGVTACNGSETGETDTDTDTDADSDTDTDEDAKLTVTVLTDGAIATCSINVDKSYLGPSDSCLGLKDQGSELSLTAGDYKKREAYGITDKQTDGLPLHENAPGDLWIAPITVIDAPATNQCSEEPDVEIGMNQFAWNEWTCAAPDLDIVESSIVTYEDGQYLTLQLIGKVKVTGRALSYDSGPDSITGGFVSPTEIIATGHISGGSDIDIHCWAGDEDAEP